VTTSLLVASAAFNLWLFSPIFWNEIGVDNKDLYAAASLVEQGGNPYDVAQLVAEQDRLYNTPQGLKPTDPGYYHHATYGYPPLFTRLSRLALGLGAVAYYVVSLVVILAAGIVGMEALLRAVDWHGRWLPRLFFLASTPLALAAFVGNPSTLLLLSWGAALWLAIRGRPLLAGAALSLCLVKLPVGLPIAAALLVAVPAARLRVLSGMIIGATTLLLADLALTGTAALGQWVAGLGVYGGSLSTTQGRSLFSQSGLAGIPGLFVDHVSVPLAVIIAAVPVGAALAWAWSARRRTDAGGDPVLRLALLTAAALAVSPYLHLNDLVLEALPLLVLASRPLTALSKVALVVWAIGVPARLVISVLLAPIIGTGGGAESSAGFGIALTVLILTALAVSARQVPRPDASPAPAADPAWR
jgi:hypothetical protein